MTNQEIDRIIHEAMGKQWFTPADKIVYGCPAMPSYTSSWSAYGPMLEWVMNQEWWDKMAYEEVDQDDIGNSIYDFNTYLLNPLRGSTAIAEFLKERK